MELHSYRIRAETLTLKLENAKKSLRRKDDYISWWRILQVKIIMKKKYFLFFLELYRRGLKRADFLNFTKLQKYFTSATIPAQIFCSF